MSDEKHVSLRNLDYSPMVNPLMEPRQIQVRRRFVSTRSSSQQLMNTVTGEMTAIAVIQTVEERDDAEFVKVFADGVRAAFDLSRTGYRVFQAVLAVYQSTTMRGGYAEAVELYWFGPGLNGQVLDMSEKTFQRGLKELLSKDFLYPRAPSSFWVNPSLFFKGDRVAFVKEYKRKSIPKDLELVG